MRKLLKYMVELMNILEVTEDKIFQTLGKGRDAKYKPIDKAKLKKPVEHFDFTRLLK
jgi:hypothetical protein